MKAEYYDVWFRDGIEIAGPKKVVDLPFRRTSARAIIIRKRDLAILGTLHRKKGSFALPGGAIEDGESSAQALKRELDEENINLVKPDRGWENTFTVDYFDGYKELSIWHIIPVEDVSLEESEENIESKWIPQGDDVWYPFMRERIILAICRSKPELTNKSVVIS